MFKEYTKEELWKAYEKLPEELQEVVFSTETADDTYNICERNDIKAVSVVAKYVGQVLLGVLAPDDFQKELENGLKLKKDSAKKLAQEINRFIFYPVKPALEQLYRMEINPPAQPSKASPPPEEKPTMPTEPRGEDTYREPVE